MRPFGVALRIRASVKKPLPAKVVPTGGPRVPAIVPTTSCVPTVSRVTGVDNSRPLTVNEMPIFTGFLTAMDSLRRLVLSGT